MIDWDVADYDETNKSVTLLLHDTLPTKLPFDSDQALAYCDNGTPAGNYRFDNNGTSYYFTLNEAIPSGGQLKADTHDFYTYASQESTEAIETGRVSTTANQNPMFLGTCGGGIGQGALNSMDRVVYNASNNFGESGLFQWLNSSAPANTTMPMVTKFSRPYSVNAPGFLGALDPSFSMCLDNATWKCSANTIYECPVSRGGVDSQNNKYTVTAKIALASEKEIFGSYGGINAGDKVFDLFRNATSADRIKRHGSSARNWWLRSPASSPASPSAFMERMVSSAGGANNANANIAYGIVPVCKISKST